MAEKLELQSLISSKSKEEAKVWAQGNLEGRQKTPPLLTQPTLRVN